jgi:hypothetical protein
MKKSMLAFACTFLLSAVGLAAAPNDAQPEQQVLQTLNRTMQAFADKDVPTLNEVFHPDVTWGHASGYFETKEEVLKSATKPGKVESFKFSEPLVHIYGSSAVVRCVLEETDEVPSHPMQTFQYTTLWTLVKGPAGWQIVGEQRSFLKDKKAA